MYIYKVTVYVYARTRAMVDGVHSHASGQMVGGCKRT